MSLFVKRGFDLIAACLGLVVTSPVLLAAILLVWLQDRRSPFFVADRVGRAGRTFRMVKLRSMVVGADRSGVDSTGAGDARITPVGHFIRRFKLDELTQLWNVLIGDMSIVGPRPNLRRETDLYTPPERGLLAIKPGITDFASVVFSDEGEILKDKADPDIAYNQLIRPGKSRLGLFYIENRSLLMDAFLCVLTMLAVTSRPHALAGVQSLLRRHGAPADLVYLAGRTAVLVPAPPPGATEIVNSRG
jgi:lipopolysaccharide/colanic/teichoic acid biosynthesis glycosyltransferase